MLWPELVLLLTSSTGWSIILNKGLSNIMEIHDRMVMMIIHQSRYVTSPSSRL